MLAIRPQRVREQDWVMVGEMPVERPAQLNFVCFTWINGVDLRYGSTADQGRTGREDSSSRLWRPAQAPGTHAKRGPSTGHSAVGLRQGGEMFPDAEATFHCASCTLGNQVVRASDGPPFRQERRPTRLCRTPGPRSLPPDGVAALTAAGYQVFAINPLAVTRYRDRNVSTQLTGRVHVFLTCAIPGIE